MQLKLLHESEQMEIRLLRSPSRLRLREVPMLSSPLPPRYVHRCSSHPSHSFPPNRLAGYTAPPSSALGDFLVQRAIQQQLYYHAQLGNEPMLDWLKRFRSHEHLDSFERGEGRNGMPGTYSATFDQLKTLPFTSYLEALGTEPDSSIEVSFVKPQRRLSARERANPYLNNQPPVVEIYDQPIITSKILSQLLNTADALVETWAFHFTEAEKNDLIRVASDRAEMMAMPSTMMLEWRALEKGGETAYSRLTGDEAMVSIYIFVYILGKIFTNHILLAPLWIRLPCV